MPRLKVHPSLITPALFRQHLKSLPDNIAGLSCSASECPIAKFLIRQTHLFRRNVAVSCVCTQVGKVDYQTPLWAARFMNTCDKLGRDAWHNPDQCPITKQEALRILTETSR